LALPLSFRRIIDNCNISPVLLHLNILFPMGISEKVANCRL
jgi:hypothetical protein